MAASPLESASRRVPKVTYVPLAVKVDPRAPGGGLAKVSYVSRLNLQPGEVSAVLRQKRGGPAPDPGDLASLMTPFEGSPLPSSLPRASSFVSVPTADLLSFGRQLQALRSQQLQTLVRQNAEPEAIATAQLLLNAVVVASNSFDASGAVSPVGMLNLERLEMTPAGLERGELVATIPLAPGETTTVFQKEWSVTSQEFTSIVTDSFVNYSEKGVTENTELAQSTTSQIAHSNQLNVNATASGGVGFVSASTSVNFGSQDQRSQSATDSRKDAVTTTKKASSRVKQEHKTSISINTVTGTQEASTRTISNPSTNPIRIDYFSLIRKWRVRLYRYGLRLTYDLVIPEPGAALREAYAQLDKLQAQASGQFTFDVPHSDITTDVRAGENQPHYLVLADKYGAQVPPPPQPQTPLVVNKEFPTGGPVDIPFSVADGWITGITISFKGENIDQGGGIDLHAFIYFSNFKFDENNPLEVDDFVLLDTRGKPYLEHQSGDQTLHVEFNWHTGSSAKCNVKLAIDIAPTDSETTAWREQVWDALYNAAQTNYYAQQQQINAQISALQGLINGVDTLTLRREENDEIMKGMLRWLLGATFDFMPTDVINVAEQLAVTEEAPPWPLQPLADPLYYGEAFADASLPLSKAALSTTYQYGEMVKFINEAIEWENLVYFLYSYFWDIPASWDFIRQISHPDATRQAFLRAGSARVVVPVRKGFEQAWTNFVETGDPQTSPGAGNPYLTIAQEIYDYDQTNYPGVPPANPAADTTADPQPTVATACSQTVAASPGGPVTLTVDSTAGFLVGFTVVIDTWHGANTQESQAIIAVPSLTELTIAALKYPHDGSQTEFPIVQPGEAGLLIAEWNEYTPCSGTDIAVTSDLTTIV